jgi:hypothetical protein
MGKVIRAKTKTLEQSLKGFTKREKAKKLLDYEGGIDLSYSLSGSIERREKDVPHR